MLKIQLLIVSSLLMTLVACGSGMPEDMLTFVETQFPDATITGTYSMGIGRASQNQNVTDAWCVELDNAPSPIAVYRDLDTGIHIREAWGYGFTSCGEYDTF